MPVDFEYRCITIFDYSEEMEGPVKVEQPQDEVIATTTAAATNEPKLYIRYVGGNETHILRSP